jgi:hypothetical protein
MSDINQTFLSNKRTREEEKEINVILIYFFLFKTYFRCKNSIYSKQYNLIFFFALYCI